MEAITEGNSDLLIKLEPITHIASEPSESPLCAHMGEAKEDWFRRASEEHPKYLSPLSPSPCLSFAPSPPLHVCVFSHVHAC